MVSFVQADYKDVDALIEGFMEAITALGGYTYMDPEMEGTDEFMFIVSDKELDDEEIARVSSEEVGSDYGDENSEAGSIRDKIYNDPEKGKYFYDPGDASVYEALEFIEAMTIDQDWELTDAIAEAAAEYNIIYEDLVAAWNEKYGELGHYSSDEADADEVINEYLRVAMRMGDLLDDYSVIPEELNAETLEELIDQLDSFLEDNEIAADSIPVEEKTKRIEAAAKENEVALLARNNEE